MCVIHTIQWSCAGLDDSVDIQLAGNQTIGTNITVLAYEMNGEMGTHSTPTFAVLLLLVNFPLILYIGLPGQVYKDGSQESPDKPLPVTLQVGSNTVSCMK